MPPKRKHPSDPPDAPQVALSTRSGPYHYTRNILQSSDMQLAASSISALMSKFESKQLNDCFLPHWNATSLMNRIGFSKVQATTFLSQVTVLQRSGVVTAAKNIPQATDAHFDEVVSNVMMMGGAAVHGNMQQCIDDHLRKHGVLCNAATVSRRLNGLKPGQRSRILSPDSISLISDMMYAATASTNCKPQGTLRRLVRACAILEKRFQSYAAFMNRTRELPIFVEGSRSRALSIPMMYDSYDESNPRHQNFSQRLESQSQNPGALVASQSDAGEALLVGAQHAHVGSGELHADFGGNGNGDPGSEGSSSETSSDDDAPGQVPADGAVLDGESSSGGSISSSDISDQDDDLNPSADLGPLDPLPWNGVAPPSRTEFDAKNKLSMRYPRLRQLKKLMKDCNCHVHIAQWAAKHRRFVLFQPSPALCDFHCFCAGKVQILKLC
jgi:hypothetical protein